MDGADPIAAASSPIGLLDLPIACLHLIASFMDKNTKLQFFRTSKGSQDEPGCAVLVLRASQLQCTYRAFSDIGKVTPALRSLMHWVSDISTEVQLTVDGKPGSSRFQLLDALHSLLLYPDARTTHSGHVLGMPATYPGITSLNLCEYRCTSLIPEVVAQAFPNLKRFTATWRPYESQPLGPVLQQGLSRLEHVEADLAWRTSPDLRPSARQHIVKQLSHMPSLTSIGVDGGLLPALPAALLAKLKQLQLDVVDGDPTAEDKAALKACSRLESLKLSGSSADEWVQALPQHVPSIRALDVAVDIADQHMPSLLALPHLTSLTTTRLDVLAQDYSSAGCSWQHLELIRVCSSNITKLPLHTLNSPIKCHWFTLYLSDHAADLAAIRAAKPHLVRSGGITTHESGMRIEFPLDRVVTSEQAAEVLAEWAPCVPAPHCITCIGPCRPVIKQVLARAWPGARLQVD